MSYFPGGDPASALVPLAERGVDAASVDPTDTPSPRLWNLEARPGRATSPNPTKGTRVRGGTTCILNLRGDRRR